MPATRMIAAPDGTGRSKTMGSRMPHRVLTVAIATEIQKKPLSDWLNKRAAAAGKILGQLAPFYDPEAPDLR